jgi:hypothetical protein
VAHVPGERKTNNTNGSKFWRLKSNRKDLRSGHRRTVLNQPMTLPERADNGRD